MSNKETHFHMENVTFGRMGFLVVCKGFSRPSASGNEVMMPLYDKAAEKASEWIRTPSEAPTHVRLTLDDDAQRAIDIAEVTPL